MASTFFISDVHLGTPQIKLEKEKEKRLLAFLDYVSTYGERLVVVGDLFDFWFEYRTVIPRGYTSVLCALNQLKILGKELHYVAGNHDFWMRDYMAREIGFQLHMDPITLTIRGKRFYINHGDGVARRDKGYRLLKRIFRNKINIFLYSLIHPDLGIPFAKWISGLSREHTHHHGNVDDRDYMQLAEQKFREGYDYVVMGHLHVPNYQQIGHKVYVNLGDWIEHFTYAEFDGEHLHLRWWQR